MSAALVLAGQVLDRSHRRRVGDALLIAARQERATTVDDEARDPQEHRQHQDAEDQRLAIVASPECVNSGNQLSTRVVRAVVNEPENSVTPRMLTLAG